MAGTLTTICIARRARHLFGTRHLIEVLRYLSLPWVSDRHRSLCQLPCDLHGNAKLVSNVWMYSIGCRWGGYNNDVVCERRSSDWHLYSVQLAAAISQLLSLSVCRGLEGAGRQAIKQVPHC